MYALCNPDGTIVELVDDRGDAEGRWGHTRELVELVKDHKVGDQIDWNSKGVEIYSAPGKWR